MSIWYRFLYLIGLRPDPGPRRYELTDPLRTKLSTLAEQEGRPEDELIPELVAAGLNQYKWEKASLGLWQRLSPRERDVVALACLGYSNQQIANRLYNSPATIKTHLDNAYRKFSVHNRTDLRRVLERWDFSAWEEKK